MAKQVRHFEPLVQRPVTFDLKQVQSVIAQHGYVIVMIKYDGIRCLIKRDDAGKLRGYTRNGIEITTLREFFDDVPQEYKWLHNLIPGMVIDSEVLLKGCSFEQSSGILRRKQDNVGGGVVSLHPFDLVSFHQLTNSGACTAPSIERLATLRKLTGIDTLYSTEIYTEIIKSNFNRALANGHEGLIIRSPFQPYTGGKVLGWWKLKPDVIVGGTVIGIVHGTAGKANEDLPVGFTIQLDDGSICNATGIPDEMKHQIKKAPHKYLARCLDVKAMERTEKGNLRHPKFYRWRDPFERGVES